MDSSGSVVYGYRSTQNYQPFVTVPISAGFGVMSLYMPMQMPEVQLGNASLSTICIACIDNENGRLLKEIAHWSMLIEIDCY